MCCRTHALWRGAAIGHAGRLTLYRRVAGLSSPARGALAPFTLSTVKRFSMARLCGRAGRLVAKKHMAVSGPGSRGVWALQHGDPHRRLHRLRAGRSGDALLSWTLKSF